MPSHVTLCGTVRHTRSLRSFRLVAPNGQDLLVRTRLHSPLIEDDGKRIRITGEIRFAKDEEPYLLQDDSIYGVLSLN